MRRAFEFLHTAHAFANLRTQGLRAATVALVACVLLAPCAQAQLVLPGARPGVAKPKGDLAPATYCSTCGWKNTTNQASGRNDPAGRPLAWCDPCRKDTPQVGSPQQSGPGLAKPAASSGDGRLVIGGRPRAKPAGDAGQPAAGAVAAEPTNGAKSGGATSDAVATGGAAGAPTSPSPVTPSAAPSVLAEGEVAAAIARVRAVKSCDDAAVRAATEAMVAAGETGRLLARSTLLDPHAPLVLAAARALLVAPRENDADLVVERLRQGAPAVAAVHLYRAVCERDPVRASPSFQVEMLAHETAQVRNAARLDLSRQMDKLDPELFVPVLQHKRVDSRAEAVSLLSLSNAPRATRLLLDAASDGAARVAQAAQRALATRVDAALDADLVQAALSSRWILRKEACALLAIVEREDLLPTHILDARHVDPLLSALSSTDSFVAGVAALSLAGIGFRSADARFSEWLDGPVVDRLVHVVATREFQADLVMVQAPALRRLQALTGRRSAKDGSEWLQWWVESRANFHACRANLEVDSSEAPGLRLAFEDTRAPEEAVVLVGPELAHAAEQSGARGTVLYLDEAECRAVVESLRSFGVLSVSILPGIRGARGRGERHLEIGVRSRTKGFTFGPGESEPWFEAVTALVRSVRDAQRWQLLPPKELRADRLAFWRVEHPFWAAGPTEDARRDRLAQLALASVPGAAPSLRDLALVELERCVANGARLGAAEFRLLADWLAIETAALERAKRVALLALGAARNAGGGRAPEEMAQELVAIATRRFGAEGEALVADVLHAAGHESARRAALGADPLLRRAAARALAREPGEADIAALRALLSDKDPSVEAAAVEALGANKVEAARTELLVRARLAFPQVRAAALEAVAAMGGENVLDALVLAVGDGDPRVRLAAARGLSVVADPTATSFLVGLVAEGSDAELRAAAEEGLLKLGARAIPELSRLLHQPGGRSRREAALMLARLGSPEAVSPLLAILTQRRGDAQVAEELATLTCFDPRTQPDVVEAWWAWWEGVRHDDSLLWFRAGLERAGVPTPPLGALEGEGTLQGRLFLVEALLRPEAILAERARRELSRLLGRQLEALPPRGAEREACVKVLREELRAER